MNVSGEFTVNAPRDAVFEMIREPKSFITLVDGLRDLKEIDPTHYEAVFETKVAYLKFKFNVTVEVTNVEEPSVIEAKIEGKEVAGFVEEETPTVDIMTALKESIKQSQRKPMVKATGKPKQQEEVEEAKPKKARKTKAS